MKKDDVISCIRDFNRFYTVRLGFLNQNYLGTGYSITEMRILFEINVQKKVNAKQLSDTLRMDKSYISRIIRSLERRDIILRNMSSTDKRSYDLFLTEKGYSEMLKLIVAASEDISNVIDHVDEENRKKVCDAMYFIMNTLSVEGRIQNES